MTPNDMIELIAAGLAQYRFAKAWDEFSNSRPDLAHIYRDNARVALEALEKAGFTIIPPTSGMVQ